MNAERIKELMAAADWAEPRTGAELRALCTLALAGVQAWEWYYGKIEDITLERGLRELLYAQGANDGR